MLNRGRAREWYKCTAPVGRASRSSCCCRSVSVPRESRPELVGQHDSIPEDTDATSHPAAISLGGEGGGDEVEAACDSPHLGHCFFGSASSEAISFWNTPATSTCAHVAPHTSQIRAGIRVGSASMFWSKLCPLMLRPRDKRCKGCEPGRHSRYRRQARG